MQQIKKNLFTIFNIVNIKLLVFYISLKVVYTYI